MVSPALLRKYPVLARHLPPLVRESVKTIGVVEWDGLPSNPQILQWAEELGLGDVYISDAQEWCTLWLSAMVQRAGLKPTLRKNLLLWSQAYKLFGTPRIGDPQFGDVVVTWRRDPKGKLPDGSLGHAHIFLEKLPDGRWRTLGGNQSNMVSITPKRITTANLVAVRIPPDPL